MALSVAVYYFFIASKDQYLDKSIAVLPFIDLSQEHDLEYFSDGMMEEILNHLAKIEDLRVISRTSSMRYKEAKISVADIAKELGVTNILEGSVRKSGDRVRITVQLIDAATEKHLWSEDYDYLELKDIFAVQSDVSIRVAEILKAKLTDPVKASLKKNYTNDMQAYKFYVKGRYYWDKRTEQSFDSAEVYFKHAIEIDPQYALAYAGLADCYVVDVRTMSPESIPMAKTYVDKALSLDSTLGEAWSTMGLIKSREYDWEGSKKTFEKAIQLNPNYPAAYLFYGNVFFYTGDLQRGIKENKKALDLDPLSYPLNHVLGNHYVMTREYDLALKQGLRFKSIFNYAPSFLGLSLLEERKYQEAIQIFANLPVSAVTHGLLLSYGYSKSGEKTKAKEELDKTLEQEGIRSYFWVAVAYIGLENYDLALTQLEKGYEMRDFAMNTIKVNPLVDPLRNEPRFKALLKKMNLD
jgi:TolB-like protein/Tfp pilus assembly protein PilF